MKIIKEAMDNVPELDKEEVQPVIDPVTAEAKKEAEKQEEENKQFFDADIIKVKKPFIGAEEQPVPEEIELPKIELEESLFESARNENEIWDKVYSTLTRSDKVNPEDRIIKAKLAYRFDDDHLGSSGDSIRAFAKDEEHLKLVKAIAQKLNIPIEIKKTSGYSDPTKAFEAILTIAPNVGNARQHAAVKKNQIVQGKKNPPKDHANESLNEDYGWEVKPGMEYELLQELIDIYGADDITMSLAQAMGTYELREVLAYICRNYDFTSQYLED